MCHPDSYIHQEQCAGCEREITQWYVGELCINLKCGGPTEIKPSRTEYYCVACQAWFWQKEYKRVKGYDHLPDKDNWIRRSEGA